MDIENKIKLNAFSNNDLKIFSFLCQDAILSHDEFFFDKDQNLFVATFSRYCWEKEDIINSTINPETGKQVNDVLPLSFVTTKELIDGNK